MRSPHPRRPIEVESHAPSVPGRRVAAAAGPGHWQGWWLRASEVHRRQRKTQGRALQSRALGQAVGRVNEQARDHPRAWSAHPVRQTGHPPPIEVEAIQGCQGCRPSGPFCQPSRAERISSAPWPRRSCATDKPKASGSVPRPSAWHRREPSGMPIRARSQSVLPSGSVTQ